MEENNINSSTGSVPTAPQNTKNNQTQIAGAIVVAGLLIAGAILLKGNGGMMPQGNVPGAEQVATNLQAVSPSEHILGDANAKVVVVEYSDTECPFCKSFHNTLHSVVTKNNGQVAWVFRHFPLPQLHKKAFHEAEATECAWEQGGNDAFWQYIDQVFTRTQSNDRLDVAELPKIAADIGLDVNAFNTCLSSGRHAAKINRDVEDGKAAGAVGTPYNVVLTKKDITPKMQVEILTALNRPGAVSFSSTHKNAMTMNGALPIDMVDKIMAILLK